MSHADIHQVQAQAAQVRHTTNVARSNPHLRKAEIEGTMELTIVCACSECARSSLAAIAKAAAPEVAAGFGSELEAFVADPARPETRWDVTKPDTGAVAAVVRILRPDSPAALAKNGPPADVPNGVPDMPSPAWESALQHQVRALLAQLKGNKNDPHAALKLVDEMRAGLVAAAQAPGASGLRESLAAAKPGQQTVSTTFTRAPETGLQKAAKAKERSDWERADLGRCVRASTASNALRLSDELPRCTDLGAAVRHDQERTELIKAAASRLKVDEDELRPSHEVGLKKGSAAAIGHDERREDHLFKFGQQVAR